MDKPSRILSALAFWLFVSAATAFADGMMVPQVFYPKVEIPDQQALICYSAGIENLVIETSFKGEGTNFAWVVPLPATPEIKPVREDFFDNVRVMFRPNLIHQVHPYCIGLFFVCGVGFLGWRSYRDEVAAVKDLPLCLLLSVGAGIAVKSPFVGFVALLLTVCSRIFARTGQLSR